MYRCCGRGPACGINAYKTFEMSGRHDPDPYVVYSFQNKERVLIRAILYRKQRRT